MPNDARTQPATKRQVSSCDRTYPAPGPAKWVPITNVSVSAAALRRVRRVDAAIARSESKVLAHSGSAHCTG